MTSAQVLERMSQWLYANMADARRMFDGLAHGRGWLEYDEVVTFFREVDPQLSGEAIRYLLTQVGGDRGEAIRYLHTQVGGDRGEAIHYLLTQVGGGGGGVGLLPQLTFERADTSPEKNGHGVPSTRYQTRYQTRYLVSRGETH